LNQQKEDLRQMKEQKEMEECTFAPQTNRYNGNRAHNSEDLVERLISWKDTKDQKIEQMKNVSEPV